MPAIEELLRGELRRVTDAVQPGQLRPLRPPAPGARWRLRLVPATAAAAVIAIAAAAALLVGTSARPQPYVAPAPAPAAMPRYYVTVAKTSTGLAAVVRDSAHGSVTGTAPLPGALVGVGQSVAAAADGRTFVIAVNLVAASTLPGTVTMLYFRLSVSGDGRPGTPVELAPGLGHGEPLTGLALSPDGTMLALSLEHSAIVTHDGPYGDVEVVNLATGQTRTWSGYGEPGYLPGVPTWIEGNRTLIFIWLRITSQITGAAVIAGVRQLDASAPGSSLLASRLFPFTTLFPVIGTHSAIITSDGREIVASACHDTAPPGLPYSHGQVTAEILELSAVSGGLLRSLRTQTASYTNLAEQEALHAACTVLSADPSGDHLLVRAFGFGRLDNGVFTALPGVPSGTFLAAVAW